MIASLAIAAASALALQTAETQAPAPAPDWVAMGEARLAAAKAQKPIDTGAKNVILFIADGMDITTITAGRILAGQQAGGPGEDHVLAFETLPHVALAKTYTTDTQVPDSAGTATAMLSGYKTRSGVLNVTQSVTPGDCAGSKGQELPTLMHVAGSTGRRVGIVSTARLTHATPASVYAATPARGWEASAPDGCEDIASQLLGAVATHPIDVALGGGRIMFLPDTVTDPEYADRNGMRNDGRNLVDEWTMNGGAFVWNRDQFTALDPQADGRVLGLFEPSHMKYELDRRGAEADEPSIAEMTGFAIDKLSASDDGYFLMVEAGRVDHAHHAGNAARALEDLIAFDAAIETALSRTDAEDTLIIVTADHGHVMVMQGYPTRGNEILGLVRSNGSDGAPEDHPHPAADGKPYTTLAYGNGPGSPFGARNDQAGAVVERPFVDEETATDPDYRQQAAIPSMSETHGGQDVTVYARGPQAHLVNGVFEQNYIYYVMREALTFEPADPDPSRRGRRRNR